MKEIIEYIVKSLVIDENSVSVTETEEDDATIVHVFVAPDDMGRVIGKAGKIASSIRTIANSISSRNHKKTIVKFGE